MSARSTGERDRDAALLVVSGWLRDGLPGRDGQRRKVEAAFDLDGILRGVRKAELDSGGALAIVKALKDRGLIDIGAVPAGKGTVKFTDFLNQFFGYEKSPYVRDRLAHGHSIGRRYCGESQKMIRLFWEPAFKGRTLASITRSGLLICGECARKKRFGFWKIKQGIIFQSLISFHTQMINCQVVVTLQTTSVRKNPKIIRGASVSEQQRSVTAQAQTLIE
jgi:hypothetical protein